MATFQNVTWPLTELWRKSHNNRKPKTALAIVTLSCAVHITNSKVGRVQQVNGIHRDSMFLPSASVSFISAMHNRTVHVS